MPAMAPMARPEGALAAAAELVAEGVELVSDGVELVALVERVE